MFRTIYFVVIFLFVVVGCKKEVMPVPPSEAVIECENFPFTPITWFSTTGIQFKKPSFNPANSDEFVYFEENYIIGTVHLVIYNHSTKQKRILKENVQSTCLPKWSTAGWIAFTNQNHELWVIKENGDSLQNLNAGNANLYPYWLSDGITLQCLVSPTLGDQNALLQYTIGSSEVAHVEALYTLTNAISPTNQFVAEYYVGETGYFGFTSIGKDGHGPVISKPTGVINILSMCWSHDSKYIYYLLNRRDIYRFEVATGETKVVKKLCNKDTYATIEASADGKYLIGEKIKYSMNYVNGVATGQIFKNSSIYLIDPTTMEEVKVEL